MCGDVSQVRLPPGLPFNNIHAKWQTLIRGDAGSAVRIGGQTPHHSHWLENPSGRHKVNRAQLLFPNRLAKAHARLRGPK
jgi:hypothetical protein